MDGGGSPVPSRLAAKAKTAMQAVAAKAGALYTEIKADLKADFKHVRTSTTSSGPEAPALRASSGGEPKGELPWVAKNDHERRHESEFRERILEIAKKPDEYLLRHVDEAQIVDMKKAMQSAGVILEADENLRSLCVELVPKSMKEQEFWRRYFIAVKRIKQDILARHSEDDGANNEVDEGLDPADEAAYQSAFQVVAIFPSMIVRRLAMAIGVAKAVPTIELLASMEKAELEATQASVTDSSWSSLKRSMETGLAALAAKATGKGPKEPRKSDGGRQSLGEYHAFLWSLFDVGPQVEDDVWVVKVSGGERTLPEEIHGAPADSFIAHLAEIMGGVKTEQKMARLWIEVVKELRKRWTAGEPIPHLPVEAEPGLLFCLLHQKLQLLNACMARRKRRVEGLKALKTGSRIPPSAQPRAAPRRVSEPEGVHSPGGGSMASAEDMAGREGDEFKNEVLVVRTGGGEEVQRLGVVAEVKGLRMLESGEAVFAPATQEGPVLTEDLVRETEELILRTGSVGAGCQQLFSDMQAFKAANPGCVLEDFVRWYSPLDWIEADADEAPASTTEASNGTELGRQLSKANKGSLSQRMQADGNLWRELWESARPIPAVKQAPLFDEELAGESTLDWLLNIAPSDLFEQLFSVALGAGFAIAESAPQSKVEPLMGVMQECRTYVAHSCTRGMSAAKLERLCQVYEVMETSIHTPPEEYLAKNILAQVGDDQEAQAEEENATPDAQGQTFAEGLDSASPATPEKSEGPKQTESRELTPDAGADLLDRGKGERQREGEEAVELDKVEVRVDSTKETRQVGVEDGKVTSIAEKDKVEEEVVSKPEKGKEAEETPQVDAKVELAKLNLGVTLSALDVTKQEAKSTGVKEQEVPEEDMDRGKVPVAGLDSRSEGV